MPEPRRWVDQSQPQTLQIAVFLLYFNAGLNLLFGSDRDLYRAAVFVVTDSIDAARSLGGILWFAALIAAGLAGYGIANSKKPAYILGVVAATLPLAARLVIFLLEQIDPLRDPLNLMFDVALLALLLHPQSRDYQRIWFK